MSSYLLGRAFHILGAKQLYDLSLYRIVALEAPVAALMPFKIRCTTCI